MRGDAGDVVEVMVAYRDSFPHSDPVVSGFSTNDKTTKGRDRRGNYSLMHVKLGTMEPVFSGLY